MWKNGSDLNEDGQAVRLYEPIQYKFKGKCSPSISCVGGTPSPCPAQIDCDLCGDPVPLLVQLHVPKNPLYAPLKSNKTLHVYSCNNLSCWHQTFPDKSKKFCAGGGGIVFCRSWQEKKVESEVDQESEVSTAEETPETNPWGADNASIEDDDNDWNDENEEGVDMDDVESMLQTMEINGVKGISETEKKRSNNTKKKAVPVTKSQFPCHEIRATQEPARLHDTCSDDDEEDNVGMSAGSDAKIQEMLARYMEEEDDPEILSALRGTSNGGAIAEKEEQLPEEDRAMLAFTDRIRRSPRQVLRYARDGVPLWSVPPSWAPPSEEIPDCPCGAKRVFEFQIMPSLLHFLNVDKHAQIYHEKNSSINNEERDLNQEFSSGGQNWGTIAVYTCSENCKEYPEEYVIIQDSVDDMPEKRGDGAMAVEVELEKLIL